MSIASDIRWVAARWPDLSRYNIAKLLNTSVPNVNSALIAKVFLESRERPGALPLEVVDGASLEVVQAAAKHAGHDGKAIRVPWTLALVDAAQKYGLRPQAFVEHVVRSACEQVLGREVK